jgi:hypothetical protein
MKNFLGLAGLMGGGCLSFAFVVLVNILFYGAIIVGVVWLLRFFSII